MPMPSFYESQDDTFQILVGALLKLKLHQQICDTSRGDDGKVLKETRWSKFLGKGELGTMMGALTGHSCLRAHLH